MATGSPTGRVLPPLLDCEQPLETDRDGNELWLRTAGRKVVDEGEVGPEAFAASTGDNGKVSGARSSKQTAKGLFEFRNARRPGSAIGVWAVAVREVGTETRLIDDSECPDPVDDPSPAGHTYLDQRYQSPSQRRDIRLRLATAANTRGKLHPPASLQAVHKPHS